MPKEILIAEDSEISRLLLKKNLEKLGYSVTECADGEECLTEINKKDYDLVLIDNQMPNKTGLFVLQQLNLRLKPNPPVIMVSATGDLDVVSQAKQLGVKDFIVKPVSRDVLKAKLIKFFPKLEDIDDVEIEL